MMRAIEALLWSPGAGRAVAGALSLMAQDRLRHPPVLMRWADAGHTDWPHAIMTFTIPRRPAVALTSSDSLVLTGKGA
jgi:hypothetical protein